MKNSLTTASVKGHRPTLPTRSKPVKPVRRASKRASSSNGTIRHHSHVAHNPGMDGRHKRTWKACQRCRMKKTKCDGNFPCKRCKDNGLICIASVKSKGEYKRLPPGYAEALENTQLVLIATVHKLYSMVQNNQPWELDDPELNDQGQPVVHNIAQKLDCIQPRSDVDIPLHSLFPEDEASMAKLALRLREQQEKNEPQKEVTGKAYSVCSQTERASSWELDQSEFECDYQKTTFGNNDAMSLPVQSFMDSSSDFVFDHTPSEIGASAMFPVQSPSISNFSFWPIAIEPKPSDLALQIPQQSGVVGCIDTMNQGLVESQFGTIEPRLLSCPWPQVIWGMDNFIGNSDYHREPTRNGLSNRN